jgi:flagellar protein FlbT
MALKISLKPHERMIIDGAVITNLTTNGELLIENNVPILREKDIMREEDANTHCRKIYFVIQLMYINEKNIVLHHNTYWKLVHELVDAAPSMLGIIDQISEHILSTRYYQALKLARHLIDYEEEVLQDAS